MEILYNGRIEWLSLVLPSAALQNEELLLQARSRCCFLDKELFHSETNRSKNLEDGEILTGLRECI